MRPRALLAAAAVALLVTQAGCAGLNPGADAATPATDGDPPAASTTTAESPQETTETPAATATEPSLPVDAEAVFGRVEAMLGVDAEMPTVRVRQPADDLTIEPAPSVGSLVGATNYSGDPRACMPETVGFANASTVVVSTEELTDAEFELLLVHEYVHAVQHQTDRIAVQAPMRDTLTNTIGARTTSRAVVEGAAVYVAEQYARDHDLAWETGRPMAVRECLYENAPRGVREIYAQYYFGGRYVAERVDDPANLSTVYEQPPRTAEALVQGLERDSEPPADLHVTVESSSSWAELSRGHRGELFVRALLTSGVSDERAATAAAGWGEDVAVLFGDGGTSPKAVAWVLRFDTAADADAFAPAFDAASSGGDDYPFVRRVRVGPETVAVLGGEEAFVANATVSGTTENVTVSPPG